MKTRRHVLSVILVSALAAPPAFAQHHHAAHAQQNHAPATAPTTRPILSTPAAIEQEHRHLMHDLEAAIAAGGQTAVQARKVAAVLKPHFKQEEAFAMPPLGLLPALTQQRPLTQKQIDAAIQMADRLREHYDQMLAEHKQLHAALEDLARAAHEEHKPRQAEFAHMLMMHAGNEEQVLYPTALLIGQYLKLQQHLAP